MKITIIRKIQSLIIILATILSFSTFAGQVDWKAFQQAFNTKAEYKDTPFGFFATLTQKEQIENGVIAQYFSGVGGFNEQDIFIANRYELAHETWVQKNEELHIDQWLFAINTKEEFTFLLHRKMIQDLNGVVLFMENIDETNEAFSERFYLILQNWKL